MDAPKWPGYTFVPATTPQMRPIAVMQRDGTSFGVAWVDGWAVIERRSPTQWAEVRAFREALEAKAYCDGMDPSRNAAGIRDVRREVTRG